LIPGALEHLISFAELLVLTYLFRPPFDDLFIDIIIFLIVTR
jgi:hypothetical protein